MSKKLTYQDVKNRVEERGYRLLSKIYINNSTPITVVCENNHTWDVTLNNFHSSKHSCPYCGTRAKKTFEQVKDFIEKEGYLVMSKKEDYSNNKSPISVVCPNGGKWITNYNKFQQGVRCSCPKCCNNRPLEFEYVKKYIEEQGEVLLSESYANNRTPLKVVCKKGHTYYPTFNNYKDSDSRCPFCNESKGEKRISECLGKSGIDFIPQYKFDDCKHKKKLPFDFYLPDYNILIEYDGRQHFEKGCFGDMGEEFLRIKERDKIKTIYANQNQIKLLRIPYWEFDNIENILSNHIIR